MAWPTKNSKQHVFAYHAATKKTAAAFWNSVQFGKIPFTTENKVGWATERTFARKKVLSTTAGSTWRNREQVVKVMWHKAALPPQTDGSTAFARWRQCAPHLVHANRHPHCTGSAPCRDALSTSTVRHAWAWPRQAHFPSKLSLHVWGSGPLSNTWFLGPTWVHI